MDAARSIAREERGPAGPLTLPLENDHLRVVFLPGQGGKVTSLFSKRTGTEWLLPPLRPYAEARQDAGFEESDCGGFDECLPTIAATATMPDHGELWRQAWHHEPEPDAVVLSTVACGGDIAVRRRARLEGSALLLDYTVQNTGAVPRSLLYSAHPLLRVRKGDRIALPIEVTSMRVEGSRGGRLGCVGERVCWPIVKDAQGRAEDLGIVGKPDGVQADKLSAGPLASGWCRLSRPALGEGIEVSFDVGVLPYLGIWISRAAWPEAGAAKQYAVALEPASSPCDSLADAEHEGTAWHLAPGEGRAWSLRFAVIQLQEEKGPR